MTPRLDNHEFSQLTEVFRKLKQKSMLDDWPVYQIFGLNMTSDYPFGYRIPQGQGEVDIVFTSQDEARISIDWDEIEPVYTSINRTKDNKPFMYLYRQNGFYVLRYTDAVDFYIGESVIVCHVLDKPLQDIHVINFLPTVLALWLEFQGTPCLHGSAVVINGQAIVFLADSGQGKSTLAASFLQAGYSLLTDDKLPIIQKNNTFLGQPGFPLMRLFPESAEHLRDDYQDWDFVIPGYSKRVAHVERDAYASFCHSSMPLACIYILDRAGSDASRQGKIQITSISQRDAVMELIRYDFTTQINAALGFSVDRLNFYSQLAANIPVKRLAYPAGHEYLHKVSSAILKDLEQRI